MRRSFSILSYVAVGAVLSACASSSQQAPLSDLKQEIADYAIPVRYQSYTCSQLREEAQRMPGRIEERWGRVDGIVGGTVGWALAGTGVLFPAGLLVLAITPAFEEGRQLIREYWSIKRVAIKKNCEWASELAWCPISADDTYPPKAPRGCPLYPFKEKPRSETN